jgi:hypothetical protein
MLVTTPVLLHTYFKKGMLYYEKGTQLSPLTGGGAVGYVFSANGIYDPNVTSTGHQPMGFDQLMALYEQYYVVSSTITIRFNAFQSLIPIPVAVYLSPDASVLTGASQIMENGLCKSALLSGFSGTLSATTALTLSCDVPRYYNRGKKAMLNDPELAGSAAANPVEQVYFIVTAWQALGDTATTTIHFDVILSYDVWFTEPRKLAIS